MRRLSFQQITDNRFEKDEDCLPILLNRIERIKELLNIDGVTLTVEDPYFIDWTEETNKHAEELIKKGYTHVKKVEKSFQYRANFIVSKSTRKTTWNEIMKLINSVKAVPYDFI